MESIKSSINYIFFKLAHGYIILITLVIVAILSWIAVFANAETGELGIYFFDVGQGDAIFMNFPDGKQVLVDGGPDDKVVEKLNSVMPFWDRSIDIMIATHADADHITGLVPALEHYEIGTVIWNGVPAETEIFEKWNEAVLSEGAEVLAGEYGMRIWMSKVSFLEILHPSKLTGSDPVSFEQNDLSVVFRLVYGDDTFLFTGDIERVVEQLIVSSDNAIGSKILKIPHHGSKTSSSELFLIEVNPKTVIISACRDNSYGHPHDAVLQRFEKYGIEIRRTDMEGDILLRSNGKSF